MLLFVIPPCDNNVLFFCCATASIFLENFATGHLFLFFVYTAYLFFKKNITHSPSPQELEVKLRLFFELGSFYILAVLQLTVTTRYGD
jgi:hypothetical protein